MYQMDISYESRGIFRGGCELITPSLMHCQIISVWLHSIGRLIGLDLTQFSVFLGYQLVGPLCRWGGWAWEEHITSHTLRNVNVDRMLWVGSVVSTSSISIYSYRLAIA